MDLVLIGRKEVVGQRVKRFFFVCKNRAKVLISSCVEERAHFAATKTVREKDGGSCIQWLLLCVSWCDSSA